MSPKKILAGIITVVLSGIFLGYLFPVGLEAFYSADTGNWTSGVVGIWGVLPIMLILIPLGILAGYVIKEMR